MQPVQSGLNPRVKDSVCCQRRERPGGGVAEIGVLWNPRLQQQVTEGNPQPIVFDRPIMPRGVPKDQGHRLGEIMTGQDGSDPSHDEFEHDEFEHDSLGRKGFLAVGVLGDESGQDQKELNAKVPSIAKSFVQGANLVVGCIEIVGKDHPKGHQKSKSIQLVQSGRFCRYGIGTFRQWLLMMKHDLDVGKRIVPHYCHRSRIRNRW